MFSSYKNSYLQLKCGDINPRIINRAVDQARAITVTDCEDFQPPLHRLTSEQPCIPIENCDPTRRPLAFGRWAMPKLRRELHSKDLTIVKQAITTITDLVHDPERGYEAISLRVPDRMADMLVHKDPVVRERVCMALSVLGGLADGRTAIIHNAKILTNLSLLIDDPEEAVRIKAATCLEIVARFYLAAEELVDFGFVPMLLDCLSKDVEPIILIHFETLQSLLDSEKGTEAALHFYAYMTLCNFFDHLNDQVRANSLKCMRRLLVNPYGKEIARSKKLMEELNRLLHNENPDVYTSAASVIMFATIKSSMRLKTSKVRGLLKRLVVLCNDRSNPSAQMFCIKALTNISEHPIVRTIINMKHREVIEHISCGGCPELNDYKKTLLEVLDWQSHHYC